MFGNNFQLAVLCSHCAVITAYITKRNHPFLYSKFVPHISVYHEKGVLTCSRSLMMEILLIKAL